MNNEYDPYGGHTKEEADAAYEDLFKELHGEGALGNAEPPSSVYILAPNGQDLDAVCATISFAQLLKEIDSINNHIPCASSPLSDEVSFILDHFNNLNENTKNIKPQIEEINDDNYLADAEIILIGHNKPNLIMKNFNKKQIREIIDCHNLQGFETSHPVKVKILPLGAVSTIISIMFREYDVIPNQYLTALLCAGIISATNNFTSENTTQTDRLEAVLLANSAGIDIQELYSKLSNLDN